jgi:hypothetical protein
VGPVPVRKCCGGHEKASITRVKIGTTFAQSDPLLVSCGLRSRIIVGEQYSDVRLVVRSNA